MLEVIMVIGQRRIPLEILFDLLVFIEKMIHVLEFLLAQIIVDVANISIAVLNRSAIAIGAISIQSIPVHVPGFKLIFSPHERRRVFAHLFSHRSMLAQKLAEILVALQIALIVDEFRILLKRFGDVLVAI